jgi:hypothetical protein
VVAVDASGTRDAIESGLDGLLTEVDAEALGAAMTTLLESPERRRKLAAQARLKAAQFSFENQTNKLLEVYHCAIEANREGRRLLPEVHTHWEAFLDFFRRSENPPDIADQHQ